MLILLKRFSCQKFEEEGTFSNLCYKTSILGLIPKSEKDATRKKNYILKSLMNINVKFLRKILAN